MSSASLHMGVAVSVTLQVTVCSLHLFHIIAHLPPKTLGSHGSKSPFPPSGDRLGRGRQGWVHREGSREGIPARGPWTSCVKQGLRGDMGTAWEETAGDLGTESPSSGRSRGPRGPGSHAGDLELYLEAERDGPRGFTHAHTCALERFRKICGGAQVSPAEVLRTEGSV